MSDTDGRGRDGRDERDGSALDDVSEEDVERLEESVDTEDLDEEELVSLDDAARALLAKPRRGHGPIARLYRGETRFDFVGKRKIWFSLSTAIIVAGIISIILRGGLNLGIEFKGGTEWTIAAPGVTQSEAVDAMKGTGLIDPTVQLLGTGSKQTLNVQSDVNRLSQAQQDAVSKNVQKELLALTAAHAPPAAPTTTTTTKPTTTTTAKAGAAAGATTTTSPATTTTLPAGAIPKSVTDKISITTVGPTWGSSITDKAIEALIIFFIVVGIYISIRFEPKMALAAFIAMIHDVLVTVGIYSIFDFQVTPDTVVAILTILGYSLYDTVVVFDRVRDNTKGIGSSGRLTYPQLINLSMNQTLARSINTSMVAIIPVLAILLVGAQFLGATTLQSYGLALFVGLLSGAYSSIFIAAPVLSMLKERDERWVAIAKRLQQRGDSQGSYSALDRGHHEHPDERGRVRPGGPGRRGWRCRAEVRQYQAQRADPAGLGHRRRWEWEWERRGRKRGRRQRERHGHGGDGPTGRRLVDVVGGWAEAGSTAGPAAAPEQGQEAAALNG